MGGYYVKWRALIANLRGDTGAQRGGGGDKKCDASRVGSTVYGRSRGKWSDRQKVGQGWSCSRLLGVGRFRLAGVGHIELPVPKFVQTLHIREKRKDLLVVTTFWGDFQTVV